MTLYVDSTNISIKNADGTPKIQFGFGDTLYYLNQYSKQSISTNFDINKYYSGYSAKYMDDSLKFNYITITDSNGIIAKQLIGKRMPFNFPILVDYEQNNTTGDFDYYEVLFPDNSFVNMATNTKISSTYVNPEQNKIFTQQDMNVAFYRPTKKFVEYTLEEYWLITK